MPDETMPDAPAPRTTAPDADSTMASPAVLIIGAGPAGLAAAAAARARGAKVMLLEAADQLGGQYWRHLPPTRPSKHEARLHHGWAKFQKLSADLAADPGCRILTSAQVWAITPVRPNLDAQARIATSPSAFPEDSRSANSPSPFPERPQGDRHPSPFLEGPRSASSPLPERPQSDRLPSSVPERPQSDPLPSSFPEGPRSDRLPSPFPEGSRSDRLEGSGNDDLSPTPQPDVAMAAVTVHVLVGEPDGLDRKSLTFTPAALVLAAGAHDRALPFPGWDLPGVFTAGAAQALAKSERIAVGDRVLVSGAGPFLLPVASSLVQAGARVLGVLEANRLPRIISGWGTKPWQLIGAAAKGAELAGYLRTHVVNRIPYSTGRGVIAAHGTDHVTHVTTARLDEDWAPIAGTEKTVAVDAVCIGHGFTPRLELALAAGCALTTERFVVVDENQLTSVGGVYAAGELTGIAGVDAALAEGAIAGNAAAGGRVSDPAMKAQSANRATFRSFAERIENAHGIRDNWSSWLTDDTVICRCEEVTYGTLCRAAKATSSTGLRSLKLSTRAGLGLCQGRVCGRAVEELLARNAPGGALTDGVMTDRRPIAAPVRIADLAAIGAAPVSVVVGQTRRADAGVPGASEVPLGPGVPSGSEPSPGSATASATSPGSATLPTSPVPGDAAGETAAPPSESTT